VKGVGIEAKLSPLLGSVPPTLGFQPTIKPSSVAKIKMAGA
jgi:hypothetical protein